MLCRSPKLLAFASISVTKRTGRHRSDHEIRNLRCRLHLRTLTCGKASVKLDWRLLRGQSLIVSICGRLDELLQNTSSSSAWHRQTDTGSSPENLDPEIASCGASRQARPRTGKLPPEAALKP